MAYCTAAQVAEEFSGVSFNASSNPTSTTVDRWIAEADAIINSKVSQRYTAPITHADDLVIIRTISIMMVAARVRRRLNRTGPEGEPAKVKVTDTYDQAMKMLDQIAKGIMLLPNSTLANSDVGVKSFSASYASQCAADDAADDIDAHEFRKGRDQW